MKTGHRWDLTKGHGMGDAALVLPLVVSGLVLLVWAQPPSRLLCYVPSIGSSPVSPLGICICRRFPWANNSCSTPPTMGGSFSSFGSQLKHHLLERLLWSLLRVDKQPAIPTNRHSLFQHPASSSSPHHWSYLLWSHTSSSLPPWFEPPRKREVLSAVLPSAFLY